MRYILLAAIAVLLAAGPLAAHPAAASYTPGPGHRANEISGRDAVSKGVVSLSDYAGKWVFVDFWASWCGPCMDELPNLLAVTQPLRQRDDFALFSVSLDAPDTDAVMNDVIRKHGIDYPVIYDGGGWDAVQAKEWGVRSIPATYLIDPQGNIVASGLRGEALGPALDFFLGHTGPYVPVGLAATHAAGDDGALSITVSVGNPRRTPLPLRVDWYHVVPTCAADDPEHKQRPVKVDYIEPSEDAPEIERTAKFGEWGETAYVFEVPPHAGASRVGYEVSVLLPETEALMDGKGLWVSVGGNHRFDAPKEE